MTREEFNIELLSAETIEQKTTFLHKNLVHGIPHVFNGDESSYFLFRQRISRRFNIDINNVFIVGSAKTGFSILKNTEFSFESDIDVVLVDEGLYNEYQMYLSDYQYSIDNSMHDLTLRELNQYHKFLYYFMKGWMRPDFLPLSHNIKEIRDQWFQFFNSISNGRSEVGNYVVTAGLFKNIDYFEKYHLQAVQQLFKKLSITNG